MHLPLGKGLFIWKVYRLPRPAVVERCREWGIGHLLVKFADGRADHAANEPSYLPTAKELVSLAHDAGIGVWGWPYLYLNGTGDDEAKLQAGWFRDCGFDGFVMDAEGPCTNKRMKVHAYCAALRQELPNTSIALSSYWRPSLHSELPWAEFDAICDFHMPQVYWCSADAVAVLQKSLREFARFGKPVVPTGLACASGDYRGAPQDMRRFAEAAIERGCPAYNFWYWEGMGPEQRAVLRELPVPGNGGSPTPPTPRGPFSDDVAAVARQAGEAHAAGHQAITINGITFNLVEKGWCGRFVRQAHEAAMHLPEGSWAWAAPSSACMQYHLRRAGKRVETPAPGDIICVDTGVPESRLNDLAWQRANRNFGHTGIFLGGSPAKLAENTSSTSRGPGTVISRISQLGNRKLSYYHVLPARAQIARDWAETELAWCDANNVMDRVRLDDALTRREAAVIAYRLRHLIHKADHDALAARIAALEAQPEERQPWDH